MKAVNELVYATLDCPTCGQQYGMWYETGVGSQFSRIVIVACSQCETCAIGDTLSQAVENWNRNAIHALERQAGLIEKVTHETIRKHQLAR